MRHYKRDDKRLETDDTFIRDMRRNQDERDDADKGNPNDAVLVSD